MDGIFQSYYANKILENMGYYLAGKQNGLWRRWNENGYLIDSSIYDNGAVVVNAIFEYYPNKAKLSAFITDLKKNKIYRTTYGLDGEIDIKDTLDKMPGRIYIMEMVLNYKLSKAVNLLLNY